MDFLADIGGLFTAVMGGIGFFIAGYQSFVSQKSLLKRLYGIDATQQKTRITDERENELLEREL